MYLCVYHHIVHEHIITQSAGHILCFRLHLYGEPCLLHQAYNFAHQKAHMTSMNYITPYPVVLATINDKMAVLLKYVNNFCKL